MTKPESRVEKAVAYIAANPGCRTVAIEKACGVTNAAAMLNPLVDRGYLLACKVVQPGKRSCNEYRISSSVPSGQTWAEFLADHPKPEKVPARRSANHIPAIRQPNATGASPQIVPADLPKGEPDCRHEAPAIAPVSSPSVCHANTVGLSIDKDARLTMRFDGNSLVLHHDAVREIGEFLKGVEPLWA